MTGEDYNKDLKKRKKAQISFEMQTAISKNFKGRGDFKGTPEQVTDIERFVSSVEKLVGPFPLGHGDKFKLWCDRHGRILPNETQVEMLNIDPQQGRIAIRSFSGEPKLYRALMTYMASGGRLDV